MTEDNYVNAVWKNLGNGCIYVKNDLHKSDIQNILKESSLSKVLLSSQTSSRTFEVLNEHLFSSRPDVWFQPTALTDFKFLKLMTNIESLHIDNFQIKSFEGIDNLINLKRLILYDTKSKSISLKPISNLTELTYLYISGHKKDIESISGLNKINDLTLRSITVENLNILRNFEQLEKLHVLLGGTKNYEAIIDLPKLRHFELWHVQKLADIEFISNLKRLEYLQISSLRNIVSLPKFTHNLHLVKLVLENLKGLDDISTLRNLKNLEEFWFIGANNLTPEQFKVVQQCPKLKMASVGFGSEKKNNELQEFFETIGVKSYDYKKSIFQ